MNCGCLVFDDSKKGFTLVEVMIAGTLLLGLIAILTQVIGPVMKASSRTANRVELQSLATVAMQRITDDFTHTDTTGMSGPYLDEDDTVRFALHRNAGFRQDGNPLWSTQLVLYRWTRESGRLTRTIWPASPDNSVVSPLKVTRFDKEQLDRALEEGATKTLASNVKAFSVVGGGEIPLRLPMEIGIEMEKHTDSEIVEFIELHRKVLFRN